MIDFTNCVVDTQAVYGGSDQKKGIVYNGEHYMLKMANHVKPEKRLALNSTYSNNVLSEYTSCKILKALGFSVQDVLLGYVTRGTEQKPVVACKNFIPDGYSLVEFRIIENAVLWDRRTGRIPRLKDIYEVLSVPNVYFTEQQGRAALQRYWDTFIIDAFLGNFDRHANNWGYLINSTTHSLMFAPIYDCGSCLYPNLADDALLRIMATPDEVTKRIEMFPTAALELSDKTKVNYCSYINSLQNKDCNAALLRIYPRLQMNTVANVVNGLELSKIRKQFYIFMLQQRLDKILTPAYQKLQNCLNSNNGVRSIGPKNKSAVNITYTDYMQIAASLKQYTEQENWWHIDSIDYKNETCIITCAKFRQTFAIIDVVLGVIQQTRCVSNPSALKGWRGFKK